MKITLRSRLVAWRSNLLHCMCVCVCVLIDQSINHQNYHHRFNSYFSMLTRVSVLQERSSMVRCPSCYHNLIRFQAMQYFPHGQDGTKMLVRLVLIYNYHWRNKHHLLILTHSHTHRKL